jgi:hypothetical protein
MATQRIDSATRAFIPRLDKKGGPEAAILRFVTLP